MTLSALASLVCSKVRKTDDASVSACKEFLRQRHEMIYEAALWRDTVGIWSDSLDYDTTLERWFPEFHCTPEIDRVLAVRWRTNRDLVPSDLGAWMQLDPEFYEQSGEPATFVEIESDGVSWNIPAETQMTFTISNAADVGTVVEIIGTDNGGEALFETVTLTAGDTTTVNSYRTVRSISKPVTSGAVTVEGAGAEPGRMQLDPHDTVSRCCVLRFNRVPAANAADPFADQPGLLIRAKRKLSSFVRDSDAPMIRGSDNALIAFAQADMLERERQYAKAQAKVAEGQALLTLMLAAETQQNAGVQQLVPLIHPHAGGVDDFGY